MECGGEIGLGSAGDEAGEREDELPVTGFDVRALRQVVGGEEGCTGGVERRGFVGFECCNDSGVEAVGLGEVFRDVAVEKTGSGDGFE